MMMLYQARSGKRVKVGITASIDNRVAAYQTHNPEVSIIVKRTDLTDWGASFVEKHAHFVLCAKPGDEWVIATDEQVESAIAIAEECRINLEAAQLRYAIEQLAAYCETKTPQEVFEEARAAGMEQELFRIAGWLLEYHRLCKEHGSPRVM